MNLKSLQLTDEFSFISSHHPLNKKYARSNACTGKLALMKPKTKTKKLFTDSIVPACMRILRELP
jgi:hypothetical protein